MKRFIIMWTILALAALPGMVVGATITGFDSTQPRGADQYFPDFPDYQFTPYNDRGQDLRPVSEGFRAPQYRAEEQDGDYEDWAGMMMGNATRDPAFFATLSVANQDFLNLLYAAAGKGLDIYNPDLMSLVGIGTAREVVCALKIYDPYASSTDACDPGGTIVLLPEDQLPVTADICLRCHSPVGWMEAHSEPFSPQFPFLKGQFWGAGFQENPVDDYGNPRYVDQWKESEAEMEGIQCDFCHRSKDNFKRWSQYDGSTMANGLGGFFVSRYDPFDEEAEPEFDFQEEGLFCGTCHDVTNPLIYTKTEGADKMLHPIERTYTEWYWSDFRKEESCQDCHEPMEFLGAQTWLLYSGIDDLWNKLGYGDIDQKWRESPYYYKVPYRSSILMDAMERNRRFMQEEAADVMILQTPAMPMAGQPFTFTTRVINKTGHKLPTGFAEGRQMWLHIEVSDENGNIIWEDGVIDAHGELVRTDETKVWEQLVLAKGYDNFDINGRNILDADGDGNVSHYEKEFHFVLMNYIEKDNRIPPKGFNKAAYMKDGAFIIPHDPKDTDYPGGQYWDDTSYTFMVPDNYDGKMKISATLKYQTFNNHYMKFLYDMDQEKTIANGGRARNIPEGPYAHHDTWGKVMYDIWDNADKGRPVIMQSVQMNYGYTEYHDHDDHHDHHD